MALQSVSTSGGLFFKGSSRPCGMVYFHAADDSALLQRIIRDCAATWINSLEGRE